MKRMALQEARTWPSVVMLTLTLDPSRVNGDAYGLLARAWDRLSRKLRQEYGGLRYMAFLQVQPGTRLPHLHVLVDRRLSAVFVRQEWTLAGATKFGPGVNLKELPTDRAVSYAARYLGKDMHRVSVPLFARRVWASRGIDLGLARRRGGSTARVEVAESSLGLPVTRKSFRTEKELWSEARRVVSEGKPR